MSLRDALLNAGKIDKKQKKNADKKQRTEEHQKRKRKKKKKKTPDAPSHEQTVASAIARKQQKLIDLVEEGRLLEPGRRRFHFVARNEEIHFIQVSDVLGMQLESGKAAIVEDPAASARFSEHTAVSLDATLKIIEHERDAVRFFLPA